MRSLPWSATKTCPLPSTATPTGPANWPGPLPALPHVVRKVPPLSNFWMRSLPSSATKTFPLPSTATPTGPPNCPGPLPALPHVVRKVPPLSNFWMRSLPSSATKTFPLPSTATPTAPPNCPGPRPALPHVVTKVPQGPTRSSMALWHASVSARTAPAATQPPTALSTVVVRPSSLALHPAKLAGVLTSLAWQRSSRRPLVPMALALADGHAPLPGSSVRNAATQLSTAASIAAATPGQPPSALLMVVSALLCALPRQVESTLVPASFAFA